MGDWPAAVLWDLDGTLVDTEPAWMAAEAALAERYGGSWTAEDGLALVGSNLLDSGRIMRDKLGLSLTPEEIVDDLVDAVEKSVTESVLWQPGARELLDAVRAARIPCAMVTMSYRRLAVPIVAGLPAGTFAVVVTGDEVSRGKPHPEAYLAAAEALGVRAEDCLAIEDSATGSASAAAAGCTVLVVPAHVPVPPGPGLVITEALEGWTLERLRSLRKLPR